MVPSSRRQVLRLGALAAAAAVAMRNSAWAAASPWDRGHRSRVRLVAGGREGGVLLAGIEIALDPGHKTYWRHPGEAGLPPAFDWSGSRNVKRAEVLWPAPSRLEDPGGVAYGYEGGVTLPVRVEPERPGEPVELRLALDYGVCKEICIPAKAALALALAGKAEEIEPAVAAALARVPRSGKVGENRAVSIRSIEPLSGDKPALSVAVQAPSKPTLFVEAPDGWFFGSGEATGLGEQYWVRVEALDRPPGPPRPVEITLTLVAGDRAVEAKAELDEALRPR